MREIKKREFERLLFDNGFIKDDRGKHKVFRDSFGRHVALPRGHGNTMNGLIAKRLIKELGLKGEL